MDALNLRVLESDAHGIVIERWDMCRRRIYTGGGIAGNSHEVWMDVPGMPHVGPFGPYRTKGALTRALREWRRRELDVLGRSYANGQ